MRTMLLLLILLLSAAIATGQQNHLEKIRSILEKGNPNAITAIAPGEQNHLENIQSALQKGDPKAITAAIAAAQLNPQELKSNDTITQISRIIASIACKYGQNDLDGYSNYKDEVSGSKLIILQPHVAISFFHDFDFRGVLEMKYREPYNEKRRSDTTYFWPEFVDRSKQAIFKEFMASVYSENIPLQKTDKNFPYYKAYYTLRLKDGFDQDRIISLDTTLVKQINSYLKEKTEQLNSEQIQKVLNAYWKTSSNKTSIHFGYNMVIDNIIFNDKLDMCIVQFSASGSSFGSSYEAFLFKLDDNWPVAYVRETGHYDFERRDTK